MFWKKMIFPPLESLRVIAQSICEIWEAEKSVAICICYIILMYFRTSHP